MDLLKKLSSDPQHIASYIVEDQKARLSREDELLQWAKSQLYTLPVVSFQSPQAAAIKEIATNNRKVQRMLKRISDIQNSTCRLQATISPVRHLPPEILRRIFEELKSITPSNFTFKAAHPRLYYSLSILAVCRRWKLVALNTPRLWSQIDIHPYYQTPFVNQLAEYMGHSGTTSLDITITDQQTYTNEEAMSLLLRRSQSWRDCTFTNVKVQSLEYLFSSIHPYRNLEKFAIVTIGSFAPTARRTLLTLMPKLRELACGESFLPFISHLSAPRLCRFDLQSSTVTNELAARLPTAFPALTSLLFHGCTWACNVSPEFPLLDSFEWYGVGFTDLTFFSRCPRLNVVRLDRLNSTDVHQCPLMSSVTNLTIVGIMDKSEDAMRAFFACFPNLKKLEASTDWNGSVVLGLTQPLSGDQPHTEVPCPLPESITLKSCSFAWSDLIDFVYARTQYSKCEADCGDCNICSDPSIIGGLRVSLFYCGRAEILEEVYHDELEAYYEDNADELERESDEEEEENHYQWDPYDEDMDYDHNGFFDPYWW